MKVLGNKIFSDSVYYYELCSNNLLCVPLENKVEGTLLYVYITENNYLIISKSYMKVVSRDKDIKIYCRIGSYYVRESSYKVYFGSIFKHSII